MKAWTYASFGDLDNLSLTDQPQLEPAPGTVRIRVRAAAVNPVDWKILAGGLRDYIPVRFPATIGWDVSGVVDAVGFDVHEFAVGDEILADNMQDVVWQGSMAEYAVVPVRLAARKPEGVDFETAAAIPLAGQTALQGLRRLGVGAGDTVLVYNASGGVGSYAVQIARHRGARVIGTASTRSSERVKGLGAEPVGYGDGLVDAVHGLAPDGVDAVFDAVGGVLEQSRAVLSADGARHGRLLSIADPSFVAAGGQWEWVRPNSADTAVLAGLVASGAVRPQIARVFDFDRADEAYRLSAAGHAGGKIVVRGPQD